MQSVTRLLALWAVLGLGLTAQAQQAPVFNITAQAGCGGNPILSVSGPSGQDVCDQILAVTVPIESQCAIPGVQTAATFTPGTTAYASGGNCHVDCHHIYPPYSNACSYDVAVNVIGIPDTPKDTGAPTPAPGATPPDSPPGSCPKPPEDASQQAADSSTGDPITLGIGNKTLTVTDYRGAGANLLNFTRTYNSSVFLATANGFGHGWMHGYGQSLAGIAVPQGVAPVIAASRPDGRSLSFTKLAGKWTPDADISDTLTEVVTAGATTGYQYFNTSDDSLETYDYYGNLVSIQYRDGRTVALFYDTSTWAPLIKPNLLSVQDAFGRTISFNHDGPPVTLTVFDSNRQPISVTRAGPAITGMADPAKRVYVINNVAAGNAVTPALSLSSVTYPDLGQISYSYNEPAYTGGVDLPDRLTGVTDESLVRYDSTWYAPSGRAVQTGLAGGVAQYTVQNTLDASGRVQSTLVTDPLNTATGRGFQSLLARNRVNGVSQPAVNTTPAASRSDVFDANGNVIQSTDYNGNVTCRVFDLTRNLQLAKVEGLAPGMTCPAGVQTYVPAANTVERKISTQWHPTWHLPVARAEPLRITRWAYNGDGGVYCAPTTATIPFVSGAVPIGVLCTRTETATTDASGALGLAAPLDASVPPRTWNWTYNAQGQVLTAQSPRTDLVAKTTYSYFPTTDASGKYTQGDLNTVTDAAGNVTTFTQYDPDGRALAWTDANGTAFSASYFPRGWLQSITRGSQTTSYACYPTGLLKTITFPDRSTQTFTYDTAHRLTDVTNTLGERTHYVLDPAGNTTEVDLYDGSGTLQRSHGSRFDALSRLHQDIDTVNGLPATATLGYDANGNLQTEQDPKLQTTTQLFDALDRITHITDRANGGTDYSYNGQDRLTSVKAPNGVTTSYTLDGLGNLVTESNADVGSVRFTVDAAGNTLTHTDARPIQAQFNYDALDRPLNVTYPTVAENVSFTYDKATGCNNGAGRLCTVTDASGSTVNSYDVYGNLAHVTHTELGQTYVLSYTYTHFNGHDQLTGITLPDGRIITIGRDALGRTTSLTLPVSGATTAILTQVSYAPDGKVTKQVFGNGLDDQTRYDTGGTPTQQTFAQVVPTSANSDGDVPTLPQWAALLLALGLGAMVLRHRNGLTLILVTLLLLTPLLQIRTAYAIDEVLQFDLNRNLTSRQTPYGTTIFGYDQMDRVTSESGPTLTQTLRYDGNDNRTLDGRGAFTYVPTSDLIATRAGQVPTYDPAGNLTGDGGTRNFRYNNAGKLSQALVSNAVVATYTYNAFGQRTRKVTSQGTTVYLYQPDGKLLLEANGITGKLHVIYLYRDEVPVGQITLPGAPGYAGTAERATYLSADYLGVPRKGTDAQGHEVWRWESDAFGTAAPLQDPGATGTQTLVNLRFPGQYYDAETGLYYNGQRYYDPTTGRYTQPDPIGLSGGGNRFGYAAGNPLSSTDPTGLATVPPTPAAPPRPVPGKPYTPPQTPPNNPSQPPPEPPRPVPPKPESNACRLLYTACLRTATACGRYKPAVAAACLVGYLACQAIQGQKSD